MVVRKVDFPLIVCMHDSFQKSDTVGLSGVLTVLHVTQCQPHRVS